MSMEAFNKMLEKAMKPVTFVKQLPFVDDDGIQVPLQEYVREGCTSDYRCIITKEMFIEAYNKWIKDLK